MSLVISKEEFVKRMNWNWLGGNSEVKEVYHHIVARNMILVDADRFAELKKLLKAMFTIDNIEYYGAISEEVKKIVE